MSGLDTATYDYRGMATRAECEFVSHLGQHAMGKGKRPEHLGIEGDRLALLHGYLRSMARRTDWGVIDSHAVKAVVLAEIEQEVKHRAAFIPRNGHGIFGSRQYARRAGHRGGSE